MFYTAGCIARGVEIRQLKLKTNYDQEYLLNQWIYFTLICHKLKQS